MADKTGRTKTFYTREAILKHLEDMEDYYLAAESYAEFLESGEQAISSEQIGKELGLED